MNAQSGSQSASPSRDGTAVSGTFNLMPAVPVLLFFLVACLIVWRRKAKGPSMTPKNLRDWSVYPVRVTGFDGV